jgi:D-alanyl-D-alanine carboxypeptidase/D-alanyl-D-alanine-endopeptidase (penicillin-binding protein 4)
MEDRPPRTIIERRRSAAHGPTGPSRAHASPRRSVSALAALAALVFAAPAPAALADRLDRALRGSGVGWDAQGVVAVNLETRRVVFVRNAGGSLQPASNEKLTVAVAALDRLGAGHRIPTRVYGEGLLDGTTWRGRLVLKGFGDPTLDRADLAWMAKALRDGGIRRVTGGIRGDESWFDKRRTAPGWKASFYKLECPPLSALIFDRGKVGRHTTDNPALAAAAAFRRELLKAGVKVGGGAGLAVAADGATELVTTLSPPLWSLVRTLNRSSDNFYAEMLLKQLGAVRRGSGTTASGARVVRAVLVARGVPMAGVRIVDGSGLSSLDRLTARALSRLLVSAWDDKSVRSNVFLSLPLAGVNGTLRDRMRRPPAYRNVRAKTGTTMNASALSGYARQKWVFSILQNGRPINWTTARASQDRFAQVLAGS